MSEEWIEYTRDSEPPTSGFVEIINTFNPHERTYMDMSDKLKTGLPMVIWNHAAPVCVDKYRFITEAEFIQAQIRNLQNDVRGLSRELRYRRTCLRECKLKLAALGDL